MRQGEQPDRECSLARARGGGRLVVMPRRWLLLLTLATLPVALVAGPGAARADTSSTAGTYVVSSCRAPDGTLAPTDHWTFSVWASSVDHYGTTCPRGGMYMTMDPNTTHAKEDLMKAWWTAPADTLIVSYSMWRTAIVGAGSHYYFTPMERRGGTEEYVGKGCR